MGSKKEEGAKILFINILKYIECGETANITINGEKYNISVNIRNGKYYIEEESFENREEFIKGLYDKTSIILSENSNIILNSIADGSVKVDSSWEAKDKNEDQVNVEKNKKYKLRKNIIIRLIIIYVFILTTVYLFYKSTIMNKGANSYIAYCINKIQLKDWTYIRKEIIAILLIINNISIIFFRENRVRLISLFKYSKKDIEEIEEEATKEDKKFEEEDVIFGNKYSACFSKGKLILIKKAEFRIINYQDIVCILNIKDYIQEKENEREICIITKDKKMINLGNMPRREKFKKRLIEKNSKILFKKTESNNKNAIINSENININKILFKYIITSKYKVWSKAMAIYSLWYYITMESKDNMSFILFSLILLLFNWCANYAISKIKKDKKKRTKNV